MTNRNFAERCTLSEQCLPDAPYRAVLTKLHADMQAALLAERNASINAVLQVIKELRPALVLTAFADKDKAWALDKVKESVEKLKETK